MESISILQMLQVSDSLFPIGAFTLSNGLETFVLDKSLKTNEDLEEYIDCFLSVLPYNELGVMMLAYKNADNKQYLQKFDEYFTALKGPMEVRIGNRKLCTRFLKIWDEIKDYTHICNYRAMIKEKKCKGIHAVVVGLYAKDINLDIYTAAAVYAYSLVSAIVTNAVKTVPLSQLAGQKILNSVLGRIQEQAKLADGITMEDLGVGAPIMDIAAMNHECLYSRLYMS